MASKQIKLCLPEAIIEKLQKEKKCFAYSSIQEIIAETLRNKYFRSTMGKTKKKGRPKKVDGRKVLSRRKIFDENGIPIEV